MSSSELIKKVDDKKLIELIKASKILDNADVPVMDRLFYNPKTNKVEKIEP